MMKIPSNIVYILIDQGGDDIGLLYELYKIAAATKIKCTKEFGKKYPYITKLIECLQPNQPGQKPAKNK